MDVVRDTVLLMISYNYQECDNFQHLPFCSEKTSIEGRCLKNAAILLVRDDGRLFEEFISVNSDAVGYMCFSNLSELSVSQDLSTCLDLIRKPNACVALKPLKG